MLVQLNHVTTGFAESGRSLAALQELHPVAEAAATVVAPKADKADRPAPALAEAKQTATKADSLEKAVEAANKTLRQNNSNLQFSIDQDTKRLVVKLVESESGKVIHQYPSEEALAITRAITELEQQITDRQSANAQSSPAGFRQGLLLKQQA